MRNAITGILAIAAFWAVGWVLFLRSIAHEEPGANANADAIVVYTGVGGDRISTAMKLLGEGAADRLLISGVNPDISRDEIAELWLGESNGFDCCVDLGHEAKTTEGNALEVRNWAQSHGFERLILVTSDYHMRRAVLETQAQLPDADIVPHPVTSGYVSSEGVPVSANAARRLAFEYTKYLAVRVRTFAAAV